MHESNNNGYCVRGINSAETRYLNSKPGDKNVLFLVRERDNITRTRKIRTLERAFFVVRVVKREYRK